MKHMVVCADSNCRWISERLDQVKARKRTGRANSDSMMRSKEDDKGGLGGGTPWSVSKKS